MIYILGSINIVIWGYLLVLLIQSFAWHEEIKGVSYYYENRKEKYANYISHIFLGYDSFIDNR